MRAKYRQNGEETEHEVETNDPIPQWLKWIIYGTFILFALAMLL